MAGKHGYAEKVGTRDLLQRPLRDLRISITDRCNFRCVYCMPKEVFGRDYAFMPRAELLTFEDEGHGIVRPANQRALYTRLAAFFAEAFGAGGGGT